MILFDTNIFIYLANGAISMNDLRDDDIAFSSITKIELLGYAAITVAEQNVLESLLEACEQLDLDKPVIEKAIKLRQNHKMTLGDSIIAATAIEYNYALWTANEKDFDHIENIQLYNPLS